MRVEYLLYSCLAIFVLALSFFVACSSGSSSSTTTGGDDDDDTYNGGDDDAIDNDCIPNGDIWKDTMSGLAWQNGEILGADWDTAMTYCQNLSYAGCEGWHLPTISELRNLIRGCESTETGGSCDVSDTCLEKSCENSSCDGCTAFGGSGLGDLYCPPELSNEGNYYWSSSTVSGDNQSAWLIGFYDGHISWDYKINDIGVRCVH